MLVHFIRQHGTGLQQDGYMTDTGQTISHYFITGKLVKRAVGEAGRAGDLLKDKRIIPAYFMKAIKP